MTQYSHPPEYPQKKVLYTHFLIDDRYDYTNAFVALILHNQIIKVEPWSLTLNTSLSRNNILSLTLGQRFK